MIFIRNFALVLLIGTSLGTVPSTFADEPTSPTMRQVIEEFTADRDNVRHRYRVRLSQRRRDAMQQVLTNTQKKLDCVDFDALPQDQRIDYLLLKNLVRHDLAEWQREIARDNQALAILPFAKPLLECIDQREQMQRIDGRNAAELMFEAQSLAKTLIDDIGEDKFQDFDPLLALRAVDRGEELLRSVRETHEFYSGYDPEYSWWCKTPYQEMRPALEEAVKTIRTKVVGLKEGDKDTIIGEPIGEAALLEELAFEMIPYSPDELVEIANREFAWCDAEMEKAAKELGFDDWRNAQNFVKDQHVAPGEQPEMIRELAWEAIRFLESHDLITIPDLCKTSWRMDMMSPERQRVNPYFLGGPTIIVSFPTDEMSHADKMMSMRGNNVHFARATVHHELIPGHHMQFYMRPRHAPYREIFNTPFWVEGWALYWEMLLYDLDFPHDAKDRVGMLFWRKHRCARIIFSLNYHLGKMTPDECVDFLVDRVGHERNNAAAEVRRSVMGGYGPLYQAAYMLGGLQIRAMHKELVQGGKMTNRHFHDAILQQNSIPIEMIRAKLTNQDLTPDFQSQWRFADETK